MKILISKKSNPDDQGILDLSKVVAIHHSSEGLEVFTQIHEQPAKFPEDSYDFYIAETNGYGLCHTVKTTIPDILNAFFQT